MSSRHSLALFRFFDLSLSLRPAESECPLLLAFFRYPEMSLRAPESESISLVPFAVPDLPSLVGQFTSLELLRFPELFFRLRFQLVSVPYSLALFRCPEMSLHWRFPGSECPALVLLLLLS